MGNSENRVTVTYPAAYFDLALLSAQLQKYTVAVTYMQQYL